MIQRIQTVYLFLAICCLAVWYFAPIGAFQWPEGQRIFNALEIWGHSDNPAPHGTGIAAAVLIALAQACLVMSVFQFKNRKKQLILGRFALVLIASTILIQYFMLSLYEPVFANTSFSINRSTGLGFYMTPAALVFVFLAQRAIRKDEELVKSLDRLR